MDCASVGASGTYAPRSTAPSDWNAGCCSTLSNAPLELVARMRSASVSASSSLLIWARPGMLLTGCAVANGISVNPGWSRNFAPASSVELTT